MLAQRPNDTRVRGAGPPRKAFIATKACKAPHPLRAIVSQHTFRDHKLQKILFGFVIERRAINALLVDEEVWSHEAD
jgi:hypothetical protein